MNQDDWHQKLTPEQFAVLRQKATEQPFSGKFVHFKGDGTFVCAACGNELFDSKTKFDSNSGWPSFYDAKSGAVKFVNDATHDMDRTEVTCAKCGGHLGHIFADAPDQPTGQRYCINSVALDFKKD